MKNDEAKTLSSINNANLKLFSYKAGHSLTQFLIQKRETESQILSFLETKYIRCPVQITDASITLLNIERVEDTIVRKILSNHINAKCFVLKGVEGEFYIVAEIVSIQKIDKFNNWFELSINHRLAVGFPSPYEILKIKKTINRN